MYWASQVALCQCRPKRLRFDPWVWKIPWRRATQSSILAWRIPWIEEPGGPQSIGSPDTTETTEYARIFGFMFDKDIPGILSVDNSIWGWGEGYQKDGSMETKKDAIWGWGARTWLLTFVLTPAPCLQLCAQAP